MAFLAWPCRCGRDCAVLRLGVDDERTEMVQTPALLESRQLRCLSQGLRLAWAGLALLAAVGIAVSYLRLTTATPEESLLYLQDQCWRHDPPRAEHSQSLVDVAARAARPSAKKEPS